MPVHSAPRLVLASASPARLAVLRAAGVSPVVVVSEVDEPAEVARIEAVTGPLEPADTALALARAKATDVHAGQRAPDDCLILGCDSVLELDARAYGKPSDIEQARARWHAMRGRSGILHTGHWLIDGRREGTGGEVGGTASTQVYFAELDDEEIEAYLQTGEPLRVAGAFTLDGLGGPYVERIDGDPSTVIGVSLPFLRDLVQRLGVPWHALRDEGDRRASTGRRALVG